MSRIGISSTGTGVESYPGDLRPRPARGAEIDQQAAAAIGAASDPPPTRKRRSVESDDELIDRIRAGDRAAFDLLYERYFKRVYGFLDRRLQNRADTEETTQEVFINVFSSIDSFRGEAPFAAWIFGLTRRTLAARFKRKRHPTVPLPETDDDLAGTARSADGSTHTAPDATPLEHYEMLERAAQLRHVLEHDLSPEQRKVFELHHLESVPIAEIARSLSKSEDSVKSNLYRTRKLLLAR